METMSSSLVSSHQKWSPEMEWGQVWALPLLGSPLQLLGNEALARDLVLVQSAG